MHGTRLRHNTPVVRSKSARGTSDVERVKQFWSTFALSPGHDDASEGEKQSGALISIIGVCNALGLGLGHIELLTLF